MTAEQAYAYSYYWDSDEDMILFYKDICIEDF